MTFTRITIPCFVLTLAAAVAACQSSGRYGTPKHAAAGVGVGVAGAVVSRAAGWCYAQCLPGTYCNHKNGLCERTHAPAPGSTAIPGKPALVANANYPPGYESEIPPLPEEGCGPATANDAGEPACEKDASASR